MNSLELHPDADHGTPGGHLDERRLWAAVLYQAFADAPHPDHQAGVLRFIESVWFETVCDLAGVDADAAAAAIRKAASGPLRRRNKVCCAESGRAGRRAA
ncbi:MAG: hypothetical protein PHT19_10405 [Methylococcus sp.]|nr:hypothetical protein [Methylococcus sp.]